MLRADEKLIQVAAGNGFSLGISLPPSAERNAWNGAWHGAWHGMGRGRSAVIDAVDFGREERPQKFTFNTIEVDQAQQHAPLVCSPLSMASTTSVRTSVPFTPMIEPSRSSGSSVPSGVAHGKNASDTSRGMSAADSAGKGNSEDICFQSRLNRAAALEKQFQTLLQK